MTDQGLQEASNDDDNDSGINVDDAMDNGVPVPVFSVKSKKRNRNNGKEKVAEDLVIDGDIDPEQAPIISKMRRQKQLNNLLLISDQ